MNNKDEIREKQSLPLKPYDPPKILSSLNLEAIATTCGKVDTSTPDTQCSNTGSGVSYS